MRHLMFKTWIASSLLCLALPSVASGGPLLDWIKEKCGKKNPNAQAGLMATSGSFTSAPTYLQPGQCQQTCLQTCQKVTVNYVPYTDYRTTWQRVPVTNYKPVTSVDPNTGCTTTCMRPCTDQQWQLQRIPYTTYRPVYQTQNYQVPVTTITNDCGTNQGCSTCGIPGAMPGTMPGVAPAAGFYQGSSGFAPNPGGNLVPADGVPVLGAQAPIADPYAGNRNGAFRPSFPTPNGVTFSNPYANPSAYSGMSTYSGYQAPARRQAPPTYTPPMPSGFEAPNPNFPANDAGSNRPTLRDDLSGPTLRHIGPNPAANAPVGQVPDPQPSLRWEYNTPPSGSSVDQSAHRDVQQKWAYNPVRLASYTSEVAVEPVAPTHDNVRDMNNPWENSTSTPTRSYNSDWN
jgi:hypothetical protein